MQLYNGNPANFLTRNNVCAENGAGSCDLYNSATEDATDLNRASTPWTVTPGTFTTFDFTDLIPTNAGPLDGAGTLDPIPTDVDGDARPNGTTDPGVHEIN